MDSIFIYYIDLPPGVHEMVSPCADGYTVYLNTSDSKERQEKAYRHAVRHIMKGDYEKIDVQEIETCTHE